MKQTFVTEKDAEAYAKSLLKEADIQIKALQKEKLSKSELQQQSKIILEQAKLAGNEAIRATKIAKKEAREKEEVDDAQIKQIIESAKESGVDPLLPKLYSVINFGAKVANRGVGYALKHPIEAAKAGLLALDIKKQLENELGVQNLKEADKNAILQSKLVANLLRDPGLWQVIGLQSAKIPRILARFRETLGKEIQDIIETPGTLSTQSKLHIVKEIMSNPDAVEALVQVVQHNKTEFAKLLTSSKTTQAMLAKYGVDANNIEKLLPSLLTIIETLPKNRETSLDIIKLAEPVISGQSKELDIRALTPHIATLIKNGITIEAAKLLTANQEDLLALASNKALEPILKGLGLDQGKVLEISKALLPVVTQLLQNQQELGQLATKLPAVMGKPVDIQQALGLIPHVQELLTGKNGVLETAVQAITTQKANIASLAAGVIKQNPSIQASLKKAFNTEKAVEVPEALITRALDVATSVLDKSNHKQLGQVLAAIQKIPVVDNKPVLSNEVVANIAVQLLPVLANGQVIKSIGLLLTPENISFLSNVPAIKELGLDQEKVLEVSKALLPVVTQVLENQQELGQLVTKLPAVMGKPVDIQQALGLIPHVQELLTGKNGVLETAVQAVAAQKANIAPIINALIRNNNALQYTLLTALGRDYEGMEMHRLFNEKPTVTVEFPPSMVTGLLDIATNILDKSNHKQLEQVLAAIQKIPVVGNKPVLSNVTVGEIAKQAAPLLANGQVVKSIESMLTPENISFLSNVPALKAYAIPENHQLIIDAGKGLLAANQPIQNFLTNHYGIVNKILTGQDNLANGKFEDTDLKPDEVVIGAQTALQVLQNVNPAALLKNHKQRIVQLMTPALSAQLGTALINDSTMLLNEENAKKMGKVVRLAGELAPIIIDTGAMLLKPDNLQEMERLAGNLAPILDEKTPAKEKLKKASEIGDFFVQQIKSPEFKKLYGEQVIPFLKENREEVSQLLTDLPKHVPALHKFKIKGKEIVNILSDPKTIDKLGSAYDAYKDGSYIKALGNVIKASIGSKDLRSVIVGATIDIARESLYPNFLRKWLVGSKVNSFINDCIKETPAGARLNLAEKFNEKSQDGNGIFSYTLRSRVCKGLDFSTLEFKNMDIDGFDFRQANFGSKKEVNFSGSTFKDVNFAESKLRGKTIDLSNTTFDMASFRSIQPLLDKALKEGKGIKTEGMKVTVSNLKDREELETMKKSAFGKLYLDPNTPGKDKVKFTTKEKKEVATEMSPTPTRPFAERATNPAVPPLPLR